MPPARDYWWGLPAVLVGVVAMLAGEVGIARAAANGLFFLLGLGVVAWMGRATWVPGPVTGGVCCGALLVSLLAPGIAGVHRWIEIGPLSLNVSMLVAPLVLAVMAQLLARGLIVGAIVLALIVQFALLSQPDAAQAVAFALGTTVLLLVHAGRPSALAIGGAAAVVALALATLPRRDPVAPVPEVEGIVGLALDASAVLGVLAVLACIVLAVPFVRSTLISRRAAEPAVRAGHAAVCAYVVVQLLAPIAFHVPVPVMGYGASTVLAYAAAFTASMAMPRLSRAARG